jgi:hypothetical protein
MYVRTRLQPLRIAPPVRRNAYGAATATPQAPAAAGLGPQICANPLPIGRYAIEIMDQPHGALDSFNLWTKNNAQNIKVVQTQSIAATDDSPAGQFTIFILNAPVFWNGTVWGCPNVAGVSVVDDTAFVAPDPPTPWDEVMDWFNKPPGGGSAGGLPTWAYVAVGTVLLLALSPTIFEISKVEAIRAEEKK